MKALFLDVDGVVQSRSNGKRFEHTKEFYELSKSLTRELKIGVKFNADTRAPEEWVIAG